MEMPKYTKFPIVILVICSIIFICGTASIFFAGEEGDIPTRTFQIFETLLMIFWVYVPMLLYRYADEKLSAPHCKVIRNGEHKIIEPRDLLVGDIVEIETGDSVPADIRLTEAVNLKIQEAALTGESVPVENISGTISGEVSINKSLTKHNYKNIKDFDCNLLVLK